MEQKQFQFADFVDEYRLNFIRVTKEPGYRDINNGNKWVEGKETEIPMTGIILPLSPDDLRRGANGSYTEKDREITVTTPMKKGDEIRYKGDTFTIDQEQPYSDYADVYIYMARGRSE
jgi:hypothetical protein